MIKLIILDVDGTLTKSNIFIGNNGEEFKEFNVKDGYMIANARKKMRENFCYYYGKKFKNSGYKSKRTGNHASLSGN